jgi:hypothetical protein
MKAIIFPLFLVSILGCNGLDTKKIDKTSIDSEVALNISKDSLYCQMLWQGDCSYQLCETKGWIASSNWDSLSNGEARILVTYDPDNTISHIKPIGIYSNVIFKSLYGDISFNEFINGEKITALGNGEKVINGESIKTKENKIAAVKKYFNDNASTYYAIAYIDEPEYIIMVTFSSGDLTDFNNYYISFDKIVQSYKYLGVHVVNEK